MGALSVVYDTNVLVSALGFGGTPLDALLYSLSTDTNLIATEDTLDELDRVLGYDHLPFTDADRERYLAILSQEVTLVAPEQTLDVIDCDPDNNMFLECAVVGEAAFIVSGDDHLLDLGDFRGISTVSPADFLGEVDRFPRNRS